MKLTHAFTICLGAALALWLAPFRPASAARPDRGADVAPTTVDTFTQRNGAIFADWPDPKALIVITGELDGYIEPCGCTGKENQKGGLSRRQNFLRAVTAAGWPLVAVDLGGHHKVVLGQPAALVRPERERDVVPAL